MLRLDPELRTANAKSAPASTVPAGNGPEQARRLDLDSAAKLATEQSPAVIVAATDVLVKAADLESARLVWRPTLSWNMSAYYGRGESTSFFAVAQVQDPGVPAALAKGDYMSNMVVFSFPLYSNATWFGGVTPLAKQAEGSQAVAQETLRLQAAAAANLVVKAYLNVVLAREQLEIYQAEYSAKIKALEVVRQRVAARQALLVEQLLIESTVAAALAGVNASTSLLTTSLIKLRSLLSLPETEQLDVAAVPDEIAPLPPLSDLIGNTVDGHPNVRTQLANVGIAKGALLQAQANYGPTLSFTTSYIAATGFDRVFERSSHPTFSQLGVTLSVPISDFGQSDAKIRSKALALTQSEQQLQSIRSTMIQDLSGAYYTAVQAKAQIPPAIAKLEQLKRAEQDTQARYDLGQVSVDKLIDDQYKALGQRIALLAGRYSEWGAYADLVMAAGLPYSTQAFKIPR